MTEGTGRWRARARARARSSQERGEATKSFVRFVVAETLYAFEVERVREIVHKGTLTVLPGMPEAVAGVADHRGDVVPIVDLRLRFGLREAPPVATKPGSAHAVKAPEKWILMNASIGLVGFVVDRVIDVVGTSQVPDEPPQVGGTIDRGIKGVIASEEGLLFILDVDRLASVVREARERGSLPPGVAVGPMVGRGEGTAR
jgi:purine-binding chemotaxis protein CheW